MIDEDACCGDDYGSLVPPLLTLMINDDAGYGEEIIARPEINKDNAEIGGQKHDRYFSVKNCKKWGKEQNE